MTDRTTLAVLGRLLDDDSSQVRRDAAFSVSSRYSRVFLEPLLRRLEDDPCVSVRIACAMALGNARGRRVILALKNVLATDDSTAVAACRALAMIPTGTTIVLKNALTHSNPIVRLVAADALVQRGRELRSARTALLALRAAGEPTYYDQMVRPLKEAGMELAQMVVAPAAELISVIDATLSDERDSHNGHAQRRLADLSSGG
jgi:HEAT repeat protein